MINSLNNIERSIKAAIKFIEEQIELEKNREADTINKGESKKVD